MPFFVRFMRLFVTRLTGWKRPVILVAFIFATSWPLMWLAEPAGSDIVKPQNFFWWFIVTTATVGYGDFFPKTFWGHSVGVYVIIGGIATLTILITQIGAAIQATKGRHMSGTAQLSLSGHIVIVGYEPIRTAQIVAELKAQRAEHIVICESPDRLSEHPMPHEHNVHFVRAAYVSAELLERSCVSSARSVIIDVDKDDAVTMLAGRMDRVAPNTHIVVALHDLDYAAVVLEQVGSNVACLPETAGILVAGEALNPGVSGFVTDIMSSQGGTNVYGWALPIEFAGRDVGELQGSFKRQANATIVAVVSGSSQQVNPSWGHRLHGGGDTVFYIAEQPLPANFLKELSLAAA